MGWGNAELIHPVESDVAIMGTVIIPFWVYLDVELKVHATTERIRNFLSGN